MTEKEIKEWKKTWKRCPKNWVSGKPLKVFGIYAGTLWHCAKKNYKWSK